MERNRRATRTLSTPEERKRQLAEVRRIAGEALAAHSLSDHECELILLDLALDAEQDRLDDLMETPTRSEPFGGSTPMASVLSR
jgi:hypothetical protein